MRSKPLVSIVIPLYNGSNYIEQALMCALAQTYDNVEIVVVNDGSTDNGAGKAICDKFEGRISYYEKENGGCSSALNYGIRKAKGCYISWLSHDDLYAVDKIEKQIAQYSAHGLDPSNTVISNVGGVIDSDGNKIHHPSRKKTGLLRAKDAYEYFLFQSCPNGCGLLIPKVLFDKCGYFDEGMRFVLDWNLWLKFALGGVDFYFDDEELVANRVHSMQVTVRQKELHSTETNATVDQLFSMIKSIDAEESYLRALYYFSYSCNRGNHKEIYEHIRSNDIYVNNARKLVMKARIKVRRLAKKVYHKLRTLR